MSLSLNRIQFSIFRILFILAFQVLVVKNIKLPWDSNGLASFLFFPVIIMFLPSQMSRPLTLILAFIIGLIVDMFYDSPGVSAGALTIMAYVRPVAFNIIEPRLGVKLGQESSGYSFGFISLLTYSSILLLVFCFFYFSFEYFTIYYIANILIKSVYSFFVSLILVAFYIIIFRPKI